MSYLLDSDWTIDLLAGDTDAQELARRLAPSGIAISIVTYLEVFDGTLREPDPITAQAKLESLVERLPIIPLSLEVARRCARLRDYLRRRNRRIGTRKLDLIVAATAMEHDLTLVTRNLRDFHDIPGLRLYPLA